MEEEIPCASPAKLRIQRETKKQGRRVINIKEVIAQARAGKSRRSIPDNIIVEKCAVALPLNAKAISERRVVVNGGPTLDAYVDPYLIVAENIPLDDNSGSTQGHAFWVRRALTRAPSA